MDEELIEKIELNSLPSKYKKWKTLFSYRNRVDFLPLQMREKVAEQLMACDYMLSLELWLKPFSVIEKRHKRIFVQQIASIYEGIIDSFLSNRIQKSLNNDVLVKEITKKSRFIDYRTFITSISLLEKIGKISSWKDYLIKVAEVRNYIHLSKEEQVDVNQWLTAQSSEAIRLKLNDFIEYAKINLK
ncbi:MAG: hypothetical protein WCP17_02760 [bacterium]